MTITIFLGSLLLAMAIGVPISFALLASGGIPSAGRSRGTAVGVSGAASAAMSCSGMSGPGT